MLESYGFTECRITWFTFCHLSLYLQLKSKLIHDKGGNFQGQSTKTTKSNGARIISASVENWLNPWRRFFS